MADFFRLADQVYQRGCCDSLRCYESGGRYNIDPDCNFSNGVITILFELIRDATR